MRDALDDSELYLNDDEDGVIFKRRNMEPAPKVGLLINFIVKLNNKFNYSTDPRSKVGEICLWTNKRSTSLNTFGTSNIEEDNSTTTFTQLLFAHLRNE